MNQTAAPESTPEIQVWLDRVRRYIDFRYAKYLDKDPKTNDYPMCPDYHAYVADKEKILSKLEIKLRGAYYHFKQSNNKEASFLKTAIVENSNSNNWRDYKNKQREKNKTITSDVVLDVRVLEFLEKTVDDFISVYDDIEKVLDKHFYSLPEPLNWESLED
ncbi:hypothetical protein [endosymbiont GvMRE of Glomus versiforme]|uniref:hypothetical protein n=1 Tax=endosymbiont GvMRE of Glomus versiforme TaxID=2039283 RepID=UPI0011C3F881|nr:hypothetical protein [endosymbiont GvMRE of Glomus versiforme]